ncbi:hypothetical protein BGW80DRAFT_375847 [Lactifluus volemus]|nr:hypothetical protein BGW80DRAFT_375847 [Lactifluus volemus]
MSILAVLTTFSLLSGHALSQITAPTCDSFWQWSFNSMNQDPCLVAAYLQSTCNEGSQSASSCTTFAHSPRTAYTIKGIQSGDRYPNPRTDDGKTLLMCQCNTVVYSLMSACGACQGQTWAGWYQYSTNCTNNYPTSSFPNPVPSGVRVPYWALIDVTVSGSWDSRQAYAVGDTPEVVPGVLIGNSPASSIGSSLGAWSTLTYASKTASVSVTAASTPSSNSGSSRGSSSNASAIAGGAVGGITAICAAALVFYYLRRRMPPPQGSATAAMSQTPERPLYNPDDRTTFPGYQGSNHVPETNQVPAAANTGGAVQPPTYHGLPTV